MHTRTRLHSIVADVLISESLSECELSRLTSEKMFIWEENVQCTATRSTRMRFSQVTTQYLDISSVSCFPFHFGLITVDSTTCAENGLNDCSTWHLAESWIENALSLPLRPGHMLHLMHWSVTRRNSLNEFHIILPFELRRNTHDISRKIYLIDYFYLPFVKHTIRWLSNKSSKFYRYHSHIRRMNFKKMGEYLFVSLKRTKPWNQWTCARLHWIRSLKAIVL